MEELKSLFGESMWKHLNGETSYLFEKHEWEFLYDESYPWTEEEWENEIKGKSLFELLPKEPYQSSKESAKNG